MRRFYFSILILIVLSAVPSLAQTVRIQAPAQCEVGRPITVRYVTDTQNVEDIQVGKFPGFEVMFGPATSIQSSSYMINGHTTESNSMTFSYTLMPQKSGTYKLPAVTLKCGGKSIRSNSASIQILPGNGNSSGSQRGGSQNQRQQQSGGDVQISQSHVRSGDVFILATASKKTVYEQEAIVLTYKLYTLANIRSLSGEMPDLDGFHCQELDNQPQMSLKVERYKGKNYYTGVWRQYVLFPQRSGQLKVPSVDFEAEIQVTNPNIDPFDAFFGGQSIAQMVKKTIKTPSVDINVKALPTPKPAAFSGAVGHFTVSGSLSPQQITANDAATLRLVISGNGNMKLMKAPQVNFDKDFEIYDPKENNKTRTTSEGNKGNVTFDYVVVPRHGGKYKIDPVEFVYFDPDKGQYRTIKIQSFEIAVAKGKGTQGMSAKEQEDLRILSSDIHYIKIGDSKIEQKTDNFFLTTLYLCCYGTSIVAFILLTVLTKRQIKANANVIVRRTRGASKAAGRRLKAAGKLLKKQDTNAFFDETLRALMGYAGDKMGINIQDLNKDNLRQAFIQHGVDNALIDRYMDVLAQCEFARFAPGDPAATMDAVFTSATEAINQMEKAM